MKVTPRRYARSVTARTTQEAFGDCDRAQWFEGPPERTTLSRFAYRALALVVVLALAHTVAVLAFHLYTKAIAS